MTKTKMASPDIELIIRAYFTARATDGEDYDENHEIVVDIIRRYPEYANFYLTSEEREGTE